MKEKKIAIVLTVLAIVITIIGSTFAYFTWATNSSQNTAVTFTVGPTFSCSADGGGNITSAQKQLAPAACTNSTYAIQRTITTNVTNNGTTAVKMNMNLKINSINSNLSSSANFKYAITNSNTDCTTGVINSGTFQGKVANDTMTLLENVRTSGTYYLWIWLDAAETNNNTQDQSFNFSLEGSCTDDPYVYTARANSANNLNVGWVMPSVVAQYATSEAAMASFNNVPFYMRHTLSSSDVVLESYLGFVITPAMATANSGMTAGTYYLKGKSRDSVQENAQIVYDAFSGTYCSLDPYQTTVSDEFECSVDGLYISVSFRDDLYAADDYKGATCTILDSGRSYCGD